ncbi:MAG: DUF3341 domain-containing protein [Chitinophagales bacterium]|nr:DUF3341 domain-containing protein [Chitinophagales bacterium]MDW8418182.1 DUF3341 domain-containing protein [Chitinophagales bacterium]
MAETTLPNKFVVGLWDHEEVYLHAVEHIRHKGIEIYDSLTPFPVHGLEDALGLKETRLHTAGFMFGATGATLALSFMTWVMTTNYPINFGGKPYWPVPSFIPITFEMTVLFAAWGMTLTYLVRNKLWPGRVPRIYDKRTTDDRFALVFNAENLNEAQIAELKEVCRKEGAVEVKDRVFTPDEQL